MIDGNAEAVITQNSNDAAVDNILSAVRIMIETVEHLNSSVMQPSVCISVRIVISEDVFEDLRPTGAGRIASCDTIAHPSNAIDVLELSTEGIGSISNGFR